MCVLGYGAEQGIEKGTVRAFLNINPRRPMSLSGFVLHFQLPGAGCR